MNVRKIIYGLDKDSERSSWLTLPIKLDGESERSSHQYSGRRAFFSLFVLLVNEAIEWRCR
jgi:hypothetical protein